MRSRNCSDNRMWSTNSSSGPAGAGSDEPGPGGLAMHARLRRRKAAAIAAVAAFEHDSEPATRPAESVTAVIACQLAAVPFVSRESEPAI